MQHSFRKSLLWLHTWSGLTIGLVVVFLAVTGAGFVLRPRLDALVNHDLLVVSACLERLPLDALAARARAIHPAGTLYAIEVTADATSSTAIQFTDKDYVYVNPCTGRVLGVQNEYGGFFGTVDWLHRFRFIEYSTGRQTAGVACAVFIVLLIIGGVILWWPRSRLAVKSALRFNPRLPGTARTLSLHKVIGLYTSVILLVVALTGIPIAFVSVKEMIYSQWGYTQPVAPSSSVPFGAKHLPMERLWQNTKAAVPGLEWAALRYPKKPDDVVEVEIREQNVPHANAKSYLYMDAYTGDTLRLTHYSDTGLGRKIYLYCIALHSGLIGGLPYELVLLVAVLAVPVQAYSGFSPYLRRKFRRAVQPALSLKVVKKTLEASDICSFELADPKGKILPAFSAGAHIDVHVRAGLVRQYSLSNNPTDRYRYVIGVLRRGDSRGGSRGLHEEIEVGNIIRTGLPKNFFPLAPSAERSLLIAGGIGVTPILCMAESLANIGADFQMHYCVRSLQRAAFMDRIKRSSFADRVTLHVSDGAPEQRLNVSALLASFGHDTHIYVCGPGELMAAVLAWAQQKGWPDTHVHREYFVAAGHDSAHDVAFDVKIVSTGSVIHVPKDRTVVAALAQAGIIIPTSCAEGVCGTCLTRVLEGEVEHHDMFLSAADRASNSVFAPCCSRARSPMLVLDL